MKIKLLLSTILTLMIGLTFAQKSYVYKTRAGAIKGYDPVAYFTESKPVKGSENYFYEWKGAKWFFSNEKNLNVFKNDPEAYAPQFGGYCAYAVSQGYTAKIAPEAWKIVDGKLYLNYSLGIKQKWEASQEKFINLAKANWPSVVE